MDAALGLAYLRDVARRRAHQAPRTTSGLALPGGLQRLHRRAPAQRTPAIRAPAPPGAPTGVARLAARRPGRPGGGGARRARGLRREVGGPHPGPARRRGSRPASPAVAATLGRWRPPAPAGPAGGGLVRRRRPLRRGGPIVGARPHVVPGQLQRSGHRAGAEVRDGPPCRGADACRRGSPAGDGAARALRGLPRRPLRRRPRRGAIPEPADQPDRERRKAPRGVRARATGGARQTRGASGSAGRQRPHGRRPRRTEPATATQCPARTARCPVARRHRGPPRGSADPW